MTESERSHRMAGVSSASSDLFLCFNSMKLSSKSLLSPGRARDPPVSLSNSLSRRLRNSGSLKGGQASPMFPTGGKKRGCAFDNPEPSSPKVTCIGQVRVKSKKKERKEMTTALSRRRDGDVNFHEGASQSRRHHHPRSCQIDASNQYDRLNQRNQKWVHLPLTICEALRAFGAEFSCLFPCRSSEREREREREREEKGRGSNGGDNNAESSCGAVFGRWLVALQDDGGGKGRDIELVVGGEEERRELRQISLRRHAVEEAEIGDEKWVVEQEEEGRVSICIPPKNALLLMRCRSDPMRVSALANRFWESPTVPREEDEDGVDEEDAERDEEEPQVASEGGEVESESKMEDKEGEECERWVSDHEEEEEEENIVAETELVMKMQEDHPDEKVEINEEVQVEHMVDGCSIEPLVDHGAIKPEEEAMLTQVAEREDSHSRCVILSVQSDSVCEEDEALAEFAALEEEEGEEPEKSVEEGEEEKVTQERSEAEEDTQGNHEEKKQSIQTEAEERERHAEVERESEVKKQERESSVLPDCLMLMMAEPKLSTEVSKETWVCGTDFIRWLPERRVNRKDAGGGDRPKKSDSKPALYQPPRSSCSFPATAELSMAALIEKKLVNPVACEPFVLTRCKSEPMRTSAAKLAPQSCFWKNSKLEPHRGVMFGVGAAGLGF